MKNFPFHILPGILILITMPACLKQEKSALVEKLEAIFYDPSFAKIPERRFSVADYGAAGDGQTLNTRSIQKAIDAAAEAGGGVVSFPAGVYLSGALFVKSNVELRIDEGVVIRAIQDDREFPDVWTRVAGIEMYWPAGLINIYEQKNVRITGKGIIDGNGKYWWDKFWGDPPLSGGMWTRYSARGVRWALDYDCRRVRAVVAYGSEDVLMKDFTVQRSGFWTVTMTYCSRVHVDGIVIRNNIGGFGPSSDGINTDSSSDILVENCDIDCNDDNLCIKSGRDADGLRVNRPAENIVYRNSITRAGHGLFTIGSETSGGMRNIEVYGLRAVGTNMGIRFKSAKVRGGVIENIWFHNIEMDSVTYPFHFELNWYPEYSYPVIPESIPADSIPDNWRIMTEPVMPPEKGIPEFHHLTISDVIVKNAGTAFYANAYPEKPIRDVRWRNVSISAAKAGSISHAREWTMENVSLTLPQGGKIELDDCQNVQQPEYLYMEKVDSRLRSRFPDFNELLDSLGSGEKTIGITVTGGNGQIIGKGDTLFSDTLRAIFITGESADFEFFEPMGDGFYITPVNIHAGGQGERLSVSAEREHHWVFYVDRKNRPSGVTGSVDWQYDNENHWLVIRKTGTAFDVAVR
jgi:polygalacturonase